MSQSVEAPSRGLWRDANFLRFWGGQASAQFGAQVTELALPVIAVLLLHASEFEVGALGAAGLAAFLVVGLPAGAWIDRLRKRRVMIVADLVRALTLAAVPLLWWAGALEVWHLMVVAAIMGIATVFFDVSYQSVIPALVRPGQIPEANGKLEATSQLAGIAGPAAGGVLISILTAPLAMLATVATYLISFGALCLTRDDERVAPREEHEPLPRAIAEGLRWVFGNAYLRRIVGTTAVSNLFGTVSFTVLPLFLLRELGFSPAQMGIVFGLSSVGGLLGALATPHLVRLVGEARAIPVSAVAFALAGLVLPLAASVPAIAFPLLVVQGFVGMASTLAYNITQVSFRQRITPGRLLGRMNASIRFVVWGVMPLAALAAGSLAAWIGVVPTMWIGAIGGLASAGFVMTRLFWSNRDLPAGE
ncbi:MFS transporter [uncultured Microbacterium sp.]|uniref:MFS transporter n=1 Tax=uncultured Microbacterium sp. TaxID=191216 RepID=UPI0025F0E718|nr:MFS transporter [uncultured Microbacterium sp.]